MAELSKQDEDKLAGHFYRLTPEMIREIMAQRRLSCIYEETESIHERWAIIRRAYQILTPIILERARKERYLGMTNPYILNWGKTFTPIEYDAWCSIRPRGLGLFPQYPVLNYFLDFGNPYLKIGVEMDGKDYHEDIEKDLKRDQKLWSQGWRIFRIKGSECYTKYRDICEIQSDYSLERDEKLSEIEAYFMNTSDGVFEALSYVYFGQTGYESETYMDFARLTLDLHRLADFDLDGISGDYRRP